MRPRGPAETEGRPRFVRDEDGGITVLADGHPQSHVRPDDPGLLAFEYVQHLALVLDALPLGPLAVTHVGGGALTLARYVEHTRPGSPQIVLEPNATLTQAVRRELPLPRRHHIRVRPVDGLTGMVGLADASADVVVLDAYAQGRVPAELTTTSYLADVARVLRPGGVLLANLADEPGLRYVARAVASLHATARFPEIALVATHDVLKGRRFGNSVLLAGRKRLPVNDIRRLVAKSPIPAGVRSGGELARLVAGARAFTDGDSAQSPTPPEPGSWRRR